MINNMFMKDYDTFQKELKEGKIEHPEDWITVDLAKKLEEWKEMKYMEMKK